MKTLFCFILGIALVAPIANSQAQQPSAKDEQSVIPTLVNELPQDTSPSILTVEEKAELLKLAIKYAELRKEQLKSEQESRLRRKELDAKTAEAKSLAVRQFFAEQNAEEREAIKAMHGILEKAVARHESTVQDRLAKAGDAVTHAGNMTKAMQEAFSAKFQADLNAHREFCNSMQQKVVDLALAAATGGGSIGVEGVVGAGAAKGATASAAAARTPTPSPESKTMPAAASGFGMSPRVKRIADSPANQPNATDAKTGKPVNADRLPLPSGPSLPIPNSNPNPDGIYPSWGFDDLVPLGRISSWIGKLGTKTAGRMGMLKSAPATTVPTRKIDVIPPAIRGPRGPKPVTGNSPGDYLEEAVAQQGLYKAPSGGLKHKWSEGGYDFEVRVHPADPNHGKIGSVYRVARRSQARDANGQGFGQEYMDSAGKWHPESTLKPGKAGHPNPNYNFEAAKDTHIQLP